MNILNQSALLLLLTILTCLLSMTADLASCSPVITPEAIGHMVFPAWITGGGMSFFSAGIFAGRMAALRATTSDVKLNRPAVDYSFKKKLRHVKEGPIPDQTSSLFPIRLGSGLL